MLYFTSFKLSAMILRPIRTSIGIHAFHPQRIRCIQTTGVVQGLPKPPALLKLTNEQENSEAMDWVTKFTASSTPIPRNLVELSFSRSSGPGGQNVNKVNTKATARCSVNSPWIPKWAVPALTTCPYYVTSSNSVLITSTTYRSQSQNVDDCLQKLREVILQAASGSIKKPTSAQQVKKVEGLMKVEKERRKLEKMKRSIIKQGRSGRGNFDF